MASIQNLIDKTYNGDNQLRRGGGALAVYFTSMNVAGVLDSDHARRLASVLVAYLYATDSNPTFFERIELRVHTKKVLKRLLGLRFYQRFNFTKWMGDHNWTDKNLVPYALLGSTVEPSFWYSKLSISSISKSYNATYRLSLANMETAPDDAVVELPSLGNTPLF